ncbi:C40 family peptidase [Solitalea canadensis]|nr:NlpC/P60 family protein [Solitalea canadensis]
MKSLFLSILFMPGFSAFSQSDSTMLTTVETKIAAIKQQYVPDRRTAVFKVTASTDQGTINLMGATTDQEAKNKLLATLQESNVNYTDNIELLPSVKLANKVFGVANLSVCNNRFEPKQSAEMATQMTLGTPVDVLMKKDGWLLVRTPDGYISWTEAMGVGLMDETEFKQWQSADKILYTEYFGHAYQQPKKESSIVADLAKGAIVKLEGEEKGFYKVTYPDNRTAYVEKKEAIPLKNWLQSRNPSAENIITTAKTLLGTPYLWGGTSIKGVDCSGFIKTSFFLNGIILPRDASQQVFAGEKVDIYENGSVNIEKGISNMQNGDLLFFSSKPDGNLNAPITHVGMYIGNGEFIHSSGMVRINSLKKEAVNYAEWQTKTLVAVRRVLSQIGTKEVTKIQEHPYYNR